MLVLPHGQVTWDSPARTLEWIIKHERVHPTDNLGRFRQRFEKHLRCFGLFHSSEIWKPVAFVHVALVPSPAASLAEVWSGQGGAGGARDSGPGDALSVSPAPHTPGCCVFYSISASHPGLRGIGIPRQLLHRVKEHLADPSTAAVHTFVTLSPIPGFASWVTTQALQVGPVIGVSWWWLFELGTARMSIVRWGGL